MLPEFGVLFLILALLFALLLVCVPVIKKSYKRQWVIPYVYAQSFCILIAYLCLTICFIRDDFSVTYVLLNSSCSLPWFYKLCAVWGGHEGSMLLWVLVLSGWMCAVLCFSRNLDEALLVRVLIVLGAISAGFILFLLMTSNPFLRQFANLNIQGRDLNPLLQDPGFLFHPPLLYMGYVGFSVAFAFAMAALWIGRLESAWARWTRPWTLAAWCCLTLGITLGSWWAYRELGWGGWWFWDPVENASFMPWLVGTALLHALMMCEKRQQFMGWTILLALSGFSLSLIGTFLVRSGVLTSVHAFAVDPARGFYILIFLSVVIGGSLTLFASRAHILSKDTTIALWSRESTLFLNTIFLMIAMLTVLMGTLYPLIIDGLGLGKLSVGAPYFNAVFVPLMLPILILMGFGIHVKWQKDEFSAQWKTLRWVVILSLGLPIILMLSRHFNISVYLGLLLGLWVIGSTSVLVWIRLRRGNWPGRGFWGMVISHYGMAVTVIGIAVSTGYGISHDVKMYPGDSVVLAGIKITFKNEQPLSGPNYHGTQAVFTVQKGKHMKIIYPEKRIYNVGNMPMTDAAIDVNPVRDVYVALGEPLDDKAWSVRLYYKPLVRWIWGGGFLMALGGLCALTSRKYYVRNSL